MQLEIVGPADIARVEFSQDGKLLFDKRRGPWTVSVTLAAPTSHTVTVADATSDQTATAGEDYTAVSGTLTFPLHPPRAAPSSVSSRTLASPLPAGHSR